MQRRSHVFVALCASVLAAALTLASPLPAAAKDNPKKAAPAAVKNGHTGQLAKAQALLLPMPQPSTSQPAAVTSPAPGAAGPLRPPVARPSLSIAPPAMRPTAVAPAAAASVSALGVPAPQAESLPAAPLAPAGLHVSLPGLPPALPAGPSIPLLLFPLLIGLWLIIAARVLTSALRQRDSRVRRLAATLDLDPTLARQLVYVPSTALTVLQDRVEAVAFDDLTGVLRRGPGLAGLEREMARADRSGAPLTVAFVDIDNLKDMNDSQGHAAGDALIMAVAAALQRRLRAADLVFRYGGDEFICVLPETGAAHARAVLEAIQRDAAWVGADFSFGVASYSRGEDAEELLERADGRLYDARREGRRRSA